jgi:hypothetical protein
MPKWEVRKVTGKGFLKDQPIKTYENLDRFGIEDLKQVHKPRAIGELMQFLVVDHLLEKGKATDADYDALETTWEGKPLPLNTIYCVVTDFEGAEGAGKEGTTAEAVKKAFQMKIEDRVVQAEGDKLFKAGAAFEARKNVAQADKPEGGVWGVRRKGPPRV